MARVSLRFQGPGCLTPAVLERLKDTVVELDLSWNAITDLLVLRELTKVRRLILSHNPALTSTTNLPRLLSVDTLWANFCGVDNLAVFVDKVATAFPNLRYLSLFGNAACRNILNGGSLAEYKDYRRFVVARLPQLVGLEDRLVSLEERDRAQEQYGGVVEKTGLQKVLGKQKKKHSKKSASRKGQVVAAEAEHPYARKKELKIPGQSADPEDEWTTDEEDVDYWKGYVAVLHKTQDS